MPEPQDIPGLKDIIDNADVDALRVFLWKQASRNTALALKLRAHLVDSQDSPSGVNKYSQVIGLLVHHDVQGTIHLTKRSIQLLRDICEHFVRLMSQYLEEGELRNAWDAGYAIITHLHMLMDKYHGPDQKLIGILSESYKHILHLLHLDPAPELKQSIYSSLLSVASKGYHVIYDINNNAISCLLQCTSDSDEHLYLRTLIVEKILNAHQQGETQHNLWSAQLFKIPDTTPELSNAVAPEHVYDIAHLLHAANDTEALTRLLNLFAPPQDLSAPQRKQWLKWRFDLALLSGKAGDIIKHGWTLLETDQDFASYQRMRNATSVHLSMAGMDSASISDELRCEIFAIEQQWDAFVSCLRRSGSLPVLIRYCKEILHNTEEAVTLMHEITASYVTHYGGPKSSEQVALLFETLRHLRMNALAAELAGLLKTDFPGRFDEIMKVKGGKKARRQATEVNGLGDLT